MASQSSSKVALVTGAGSGIGTATAELLAKQGVTVGVLTHTADQAKAVVEKITQRGGRAVA